MNKILWLVGGTALALAVFTILNAPETASGGVENTAGNLLGWGTKQRAAGAGGGLLGRVKQAAGDLAGNDDLSDEGSLDRATGAVRDAAGQTAQALGKTIHDVNKSMGS